MGGKTQGQGTGERLWKVMSADEPEIFWRSRTENVINKWYFGKSTGSVVVHDVDGIDWTVFWSGKGISGAEQYVNAALAAEKSFSYDTETTDIKEEQEEEGAALSSAAAESDEGTDIASREAPPEV